MVDDKDLEGLDPYDLMAAEAQRLDRFFSGAGRRPTGQRAVALRGLERARRARPPRVDRGLQPGVPRRHGAAVPRRRGRQGRDRPRDRQRHRHPRVRRPDTGRRSSRPGGPRRPSNREAFRARDGGNVDSSVGDYPARWQAFHLAFELATHADDVEVPVTGGGCGGAHRVAGALRPLRAEGAEARHRDRGARRPHAGAHRRRRRRPHRRAVRAGGRGAPPRRQRPRRRDRGRALGNAMTSSTAPRILVTGATGPGRVAGRARARGGATTSSRWPGSRTRRLRARLEAAGVTCVVGRSRARVARRRAGRRRLRVQLRGREERQVGRRPRGQRRGRRPADGALPRGARVPALLVDRRVRGRRRRAAARDRSARRQPPRDDADVQHQQDRGRGGRAHDVPAVRRADDDRPPERAVRRQRRLARVPPRARCKRAGPSRCTRSARTGSTRSTRTTSSRRCPRMLAAASVPATIVNWGGDEEVSIEEWCEYLAELAGVEARVRTHRPRRSAASRPTTRKRRELVGRDDGRRGRTACAAWSTPRRVCSGIRAGLVTCRPCASTRPTRVTGSRRRRGSGAARRCRGAPARASGSPSARSSGGRVRSAARASRGRRAAWRAPPGSTSSRPSRTNARSTRATSAGSSSCSVGRADRARPRPAPRARTPRRAGCERAVVAPQHEAGVDEALQRAPDGAGVEARLPGAPRRRRRRPRTSAANTRRRSSSASSPTSSRAEKATSVTRALASRRSHGRRSEEPCGSLI